MQRKWIAVLAAVAALVGLMPTGAVHADVGENACVNTVETQCGRGGGAQPPADGPGSVPRIMIQGKYVTWENQPFIDPETNRTLVPMRELANKLGIAIEWDGEHQRIWVNDGYHHLLGYILGSTYMTQDGRYRMIDQAPVIKDGRAYIPARDLVEKLGGSVYWQPDYHRIAIVYQRPSGNTSIEHARELSCAAHGFGDYPYNGGDCPSGVFYFPEVYSSFGFEVIKKAIIGGVNLEPAYVDLLNRTAALHDGRPPKTVTEAIDATVHQVLTDIAIAELIGLFWQPAPAAPRQERALVPGAARPERTGWAYPPGGQSMSEDAIRFQSRVSGKPYSLIKVGDRNVHVWQIEEYGYTRGSNPIWFDALDDGILIDAKTIPAKWIGADGRLTQFASNTGAVDFAATARRQIASVNGEHSIRWVIDSERGLNALVDWLRSKQAWDILEHIEFTTLHS